MLFRCGLRRRHIGREKQRLGGYGVVPPVHASIRNGGELVDNGRERNRRRLVFVLFLRAGFLFLHGNEPLAVGNRDLVVIRVDFGEGQKAVSVAAILY